MDTISAVLWCEEHHAKIEFAGLGDVRVTWCDGDGVTRTYVGASFVDAVIRAKGRMK